MNNLYKGRKRLTLSLLIFLMGIVAVIGAMRAEPALCGDYCGNKTCQTSDDCFGGCTCIAGRCILVRR